MLVLSWEMTMVSAEDVPVTVRMPPVRETATTAAGVAIAEGAAARKEMAYIAGMGATAGEALADKPPVAPGPPVALAEKEIAAAGAASFAGAEGVAPDAISGGRPSIVGGITGVSV